MCRQSLLAKKEVLVVYEVAILMSCYNGEKYIFKQIESILKQENVKVRIYIRDDGSTDETLKIVKKMSSEVVLFEGENVGLKNSFASLIWNENINADFYAFADQDDLWDANKLITAIDSLAHVDGVGMYASNQRLVDANLDYIKPLFGLEENDLPFPEYNNFKDFFLHNNYFGNTIVLNDKAMQIIREYRPTDMIVQHDTWVSIIVYMFGTIIFDRQMHSSYRQHEDNVVGGIVAHSSISKKIKTLLNKQPVYGELATLLISGYQKKINTDDLKWLNTLSNLPKLSSKINVLLDRSVTDNNIYKNFVLYVLIIFSKF